MSQTKTVKLQIDAEEAIKRLEAVEAELGEISKTAKKTEQGTNTLAKGFKGIGLAWKAIGIGAVISALQFLADKFSANQKVMDAMNIVSAATGDILVKLSNIFVDLGEKASKAFTSPKDALKSFWEALKQNVVNRVEGLIDLFGALGNVIKGVFTRDLELMKSAAKDAGTAFIQLNTGLDELQQQKAAEGFKNITKEIKESTKESVAYAKAVTTLRNEVKLAEANQRQLQLTYQRDAELQRQIRDDISLTFEERIAANEELGRILDEQFAEEQALAQKKVALAELELSKNKENIDLQVALINAKTELADLDERITGQRSEQLTNLKALEAEQEADELAKAEAEAKRLADIEAANQAEIDLARKKAADLKAIQEKEAADALAIQKAKIKADKALRVTAAKDILSSIAQLAGEGTAAAKAAALAGILIDTAKGVSGAIAAGAGLPFPLNLGAIATGVASVLAGIVNAKAVLKKVPGGGGGGDTNVSVPTDSGGGGGGGPQGIELGAPNIESVEQPELGQAAPTQAYVVESDISNAQALQQELEIQATL